MPRELIFTSVPKGVKPGSTGYCTVAKHKGIDRLLDQAVEKLCFYELMKLAIKPVVHNYSILSLNTGTFYVLTRTCYSGSDHTGRTNYISHNLIFDQAEAYSQMVSPAEIFLRGTGWMNVWPLGQSPAFLQEGTCKVSIPVSTGQSSILPTWQQLTGKSLLAHELKGYPMWKFITDGGEHNKTLSLLSEFASLDPSYLQLSWAQLTFTTYLQPSERATNFKIVAGDLSVPAFKAISCSTLNISSSGGANTCFSSTGSGQFGPLPANNQPVLEQQLEGIEGEEAQTTAQHPSLHANEESFIPVQSTFSDVDTSHGMPSRKSNLNLGQSSSSPNLFGPDNVPGIKGPTKKSKLLVVLISSITIGILGAAIFAVIYFWPEKATRGINKPVEVVQTEGIHKDDSNITKLPKGSQGSSEIIDKNSIQPTSGEHQISLKVLKSDFEDLVKAINSLVDANEEGEDIDSKFSELKEKKSQIETHYPDELENEQYSFKIEELEKKLRLKRELSEVSVPNTIPLVITSGGTFTEFTFNTNGRPVAPDKTFYWDHKAKTCIDNKNLMGMHEVYWVLNERKSDGSGAFSPSFHLRKDRSYSLDRESFTNLKIPDNLKVTASSRIPNLDFPSNLGNGIYDKRITLGKSDITNYFSALNKLQVVLNFEEKGNKLKFGLIHENGGESALNERGQLINQSGKLAEINEYFNETDKPYVLKEYVNSLSKYLDEIISINRDKDKNFIDAKQKLSGLLGRSLDPDQDFEKLKLAISAKAISNIMKFEFEKKLPTDFNKAFKNKNLFKYDAGTMKFDTWADLTLSYKKFKEEEWDKKIGTAKEKFDKAKEDLDEAKNNKQDIKKLSEKTEKTEKDLKELKKQKSDYDSKFRSTFPVKSPSGFHNLKATIESSLFTIKNYSEPLGDNDLALLKNYQENLQNFISGPSYPWYVIDPQTERKILFIQ